ncbi:MAG: class I SAM-dependent methyltransferase [Calditrichia bacterium]
MEFESLIQLFYGNLDKQGPGDDDISRSVLHSLPADRIHRIVDVGCGTGRQTMLLARELKRPVFAIDTFFPFLKKVNEKAKLFKENITIVPVYMDMRELHLFFNRLDLIWCESAVYNMGFEAALQAWYSALVDQGFLVVSELTWTKDVCPEELRRYFMEMYTGMKTHRENMDLIKKHGYRLIQTEKLPESAWEEGYYEPLEKLSLNVIHHPDQDVRQYAQETLKEIEIFRKCSEYYGYVFYVMQKL